MANIALSAAERTAFQTADELSSQNLFVVSNQLLVSDVLDQSILRIFLNLLANNLAF